MSVFSFFFFNDTATTEIYTLSLHDALPISGQPGLPAQAAGSGGGAAGSGRAPGADAHALRDVQESARRRALRLWLDRKSTRLNSSHANISYAVFCLKKKKITIITTTLHYQQ